MIASSLCVVFGFLLVMAGGYIAWLRKDVAFWKKDRAFWERSAGYWRHLYNEAVLFRDTPPPADEGFLDVAQLRQALEAEQQGSVSLADQVKAQADEIAHLKRSNAYYKGKAKR